MQSAILQVQGDCEKLNLITGNLIEDHRQKQKDIDVSAAGGRSGGSVRRDSSPPALQLLLLILPSLAPQVLYQGLEKLEKEKVNRGRLEMEIEVVRARLGPSCLGGQRWREARWRGRGEGGFRLSVR